MENKIFFHSVTLDQDKCKGCINCIKRCPTEAIRVRNKKAVIIAERCIDCGECIRVCPHHAKKTIYDPLSVLKNYKYTVALPAPTLYGQFNNLDEVDIVLKALIDMGFDEVYEVSKAAEIVSSATRKLIAENKLQKPIISSACPAVTRLICVRFPSLINKVLQLNAPVEIAARLAKKQVHEKTGLAYKDIGAIFISPCPAKVTAAKMPLGTEKSEISAVVSMSDIYIELLKHMKRPEEYENNEEYLSLSESGRIGVSWATSSGEAAALLNDNYLAADGIENVINVLEGLEDEKFSDLEFIELNACSGGCVGGVMTVENPYVARAKLMKINKYLPVSLNRIKEIGDDILWDKNLEFFPVMELDTDLNIALHKMSEIEAIEKTLPNLDCGSCGAPTCKALAEDVVRGNARVEDCIFKFKENVSHLIENIQNFGEYIPTNLFECDKNKD